MFKGGWTGLVAIFILPYIQADLTHEYELHSVTTQGRADSSWYTKSYTITVSQDGSVYTAAYTSTGDRIFTGNTALVDQKITNYFQDGTVGKVVRLQVVSYNQQPSLRWGLTGCKGVYICMMK